MGISEDVPIVKRLGIKPGARVLLLDPPVGFARTLEPLPASASVALKPVSQMDLVVLFASSRAVLGELFARAKHVLAPRGAIWAAWPRTSSGFFTDLSQELVRSVGLGAGMVDDKIISINEFWAALRFVEKLRERLPLPKTSQVSLPEA
ncbi:MAG: DUF3052 domain-containing protein [Deltaproteobacteria bacterium]|nr:MAG: DUF3052 domain-containing protein [Deltaproteobacteria bacterium]